MSTPVAERVVRMCWGNQNGPISQFMRDTARYVDLEGAFRSGKTTAACWKVFTSAWEHPGMNWLICRWTDGDTHGILKPVWRRVLDAVDIVARWDASEHCDILPNGPNQSDPYRGGSKVYIKGLKPQQDISRYAKLRGMTLAGIYNDQTEELPYDFYLELKGRLSQSGYPHQMILTPNPEFAEDHYLALEFPEGNHHIDHKYYCASIYENQRNLPPNVIPDYLAAYPPGTAKHRPAVLGKRGVKVLGKPVYAGYFDSRLHSASVEMNRQLPLLESIDFGKHHPCVVWAQFTPYGGFHVLGGLMGLNMFIQDFAPIVQQYRATWFPDSLEVRTCCDPAGSHNNSQGLRENGVTVLRDHGFAPVWKENSNALDVRGAMIERIGGYMRRRTVEGEAFQIDPERQYVLGANDLRHSKFLTDGFEAGYVWDINMGSVGSKPVRKPLKDGWYEHGQNCCEYLALNFGGAQPSMRDVERHAEKVSHAAQRRAQIDHDPFRWDHGHRLQRGGGTYGRY